MRRVEVWLNVAVLAALVCWSCSDDPAAPGTDRGIADRGTADLGRDRGPDLGRDRGTDRGPDGPAGDLRPPGGTWTATAGGTDQDAAHALAVDKTGAILVAGTFKGSATFGATTLTSKGDQDMFVAKLSPGGDRWLWARSAGGKGYDLGRGVAVDAAGQVYVVGSFTDSMSLGATTLTSKGARDVFVARLSSAGAWSWATSHGTFRSDDGYGIAVDASGNSLVTGNNLLVGKVSAAGKWVWTDAPGGYMDQGLGIAVDAAGNSHVAGRIESTFKVGGKFIGSKGLEDIFVGKVSSAGKWVWTATAGAAKDDQAMDIALDASGNSHVTGSFSTTVSFGGKTLTARGERDLFLARLDAKGTWAWASSAGGKSTAYLSDQGAGIVVDAAGTSHVVGHFNGTAAFGSHSVSGPGAYDIFVAEADKTGAWTWAGVAGGYSPDYAYAVALDTAGKSLVAGSFWLGATFGTDTFTAKGKSDVFVWRPRK